MKVNRDENTPIEYNLYFISYYCCSNSKCRLHNYIVQSPSNCIMLVEIYISMRHWWFLMSIKVRWANTVTFRLKSWWFIPPAILPYNAFHRAQKNIKLFKNVWNSEFNGIKHEYNSVPITAIWWGMFFYNEMWSTVSEHGQVKLQGILNIVKNTHYIIFNYL